MTEPLVMHHDTSGIIAVLKRKQCPTQDHYGDTGCDRATHTYLTIANVTVLQADETDWCLEQCLLARHAEQTLTGQDV